MSTLYVGLLFLGLIGSLLNMGLMAKIMIRGRRVR